jgi:hypothetical protein
LQTLAALVPDPLALEAGVAVAFSGISAIRASSAVGWENLFPASSVGKKRVRDAPDRRRAL